MFKNEFDDVIAWVDGSADNDNGNPKSGCSCWLADNWYTSHRCPFGGIPDMAAMVVKMNNITSRLSTQAGLTSTQM